MVSGRGGVGVGWWFVVVVVVGGGLGGGGGEVTFQSVDRCTYEY